jgi:hypothetical protein
VGAYFLDIIFDIKPMLSNVKIPQFMDCELLQFGVKENPQTIEKSMICGFSGLARPKRFELLTFWSVARRSIQLS